MRTQLATIISLVLLSVVYANPHVFRRQAPSATSPATGAPEPTPDDTAPPAAQPAASGSAPTSTADETQARAAIGGRGQRPLLPPPPPPPPEPVGPSVFTLPDGADMIVGQIRGGFTCDDKIYGYYADTNNDCKVFHVCVPLPMDEGASSPPPPLLFSFFCNNGTLFNQEALVCDYTDNVDCSVATSYYKVNEEFGKIPTENAEGRGPAPAAPAAPSPPASGTVSARENVPAPAATTGRTPPPPPSAAADPPALAASGSAPGASASVSSPGLTASASVPGLTASASVPGASVSAELPAASGTVGVTVAPGDATPPLV